MKILDHKTIIKIQGGEQEDWIGMVEHHMFDKMDTEMANKLHKIIVINQHLIIIEM